MIARRQLLETKSTGTVAETIQRFAEAGLNINEVWASSGNAKADLRVLKELERWVVAFWALDGAAAMKEQGYDFPPINPDFDPETDWLRFERWMTGQPLTWDLRETAGQTLLSHHLSDQAVERNWAYLTGLLAEKGVVVDYPESVSIRVRHDQLVLHLRETEFEVVDEKTTTHLTGCDGDCESCPFQHECDCIEDMDFMLDEEDPLMCL